jgi:hypothetical protein
MDWQQLASLAIVCVAAALMLRSKFHRPKLHFARNTPCGCSGSGNAVPQHSVIYHVRKGERPRVIVKMK